MADARIFAELKQDHDKHRALLDRLVKAADDTERKALFTAFRTEVTAHAAAEEESLYATMLAKPDLREEAQHSVAEHKEIEDYLKQLADMTPGSKTWSETFATMKKRYLHHIDEEEEEMFPAAADGLSAEEEARLAAVFQRRKPAELKKAEEKTA